MAIITGTNGNDKYPHELEGTDAADEIHGLAGDDTLIGFNGDDVLEGGVGADELFGSSGFDYASYRSSDQGVAIVLDSFGAEGGHARGDALYSIEGLIGSAWTDYLYGDSERNILRGEGGDDDLEGRAGNDRLEGGGGRGPDVMGVDQEAGERLASPTANPSSLAKPTFRRQTPKVGAVCRNPARTDLCGGRSAMSVPTANIYQPIKPRCRSLEKQGFQGRGVGHPFLASSRVGSG